MPEARRLETLAERLRAVDSMAPSPGAKIRGWNLVLAGVTQSATRRPRVSVAQLVQTARQNDPAAAAAMESRLQQAIATHELQLSGLQGQVTNPTALTAISRARDRAVAALQAAESTGPNGKSGNPSPSPSGGKGSGG